MKWKYWALIYFVVICAPMVAPVAVYVYEPESFGVIPLEDFNMTPEMYAWGFETPRTVFFPWVVAWSTVFFVATGLLGGKVFVSEDERE